MKEIRDIELSKEDLDLLNSKLGLKSLFGNKRIDLGRTLAEVKYELKLREQQAELVKLQAWAIENRKKIVILFEGRDAAGKGGAIRRMAAHINPRYYRIVALNKPTEDEEGQWYFQRYVNKLPKPGKIVFFDRSWYNRAVLEPVNGFCDQEQYDRFMSQVNDFEKMIIASDTYLIKFYFSITKEEQEKRFEDIRKSDLKRWKLSAVDEKAQDLWDEYTKYKQVMLQDTDTEHAPWIIIKADKKTEARLKAIEYVLKAIPYK
ncbi:polyphosphate kinase 2 [Maribacter polysiphoniae]|uniref:polyphosphate kinase 2 n=1 Tax=Maribacter polysiphoniae TaxID=429344 RepID=UPI002355929B|nr:polyphosphate kinase 2 [Maribacter polysiphoniae]